MNINLVSQPMPVIVDHNQSPSCDSLFPHPFSSDLATSLASLGETLTGVELEMMMEVTCSHLSLPLLHLLILSSAAVASPFLYCTCLSCPILQ